MNVSKTPISSTLHSDRFHPKHPVFTQKVNSLELLIGAMGTSQVAIAQIYNRLDTFAETTSDNFVQVTGRFDQSDMQKAVVLTAFEAMGSTRLELMTSCL